MVKKIKTKSMRIAVISLRLAITSLVSTSLIGIFLTLDVRIFFNILSPIIILSAFVLGIRGVFIKEANNGEARRLCLCAIGIVAYSVYFYIKINSITGII
jgi:lysylphosphatidylglycerol synthetase-like protein (DUF2156 family)